MRSVPGNSVSEMGERMKGGAVKDERSPENDAILRESQAEDREVGVRNAQIVSGWTRRGGVHTISRRSPSCSSARWALPERVDSDVKDMRWRKGGEVM